MDDILLFRDDYSEEERRECKLYLDKLFSPTPYGIGDRDLAAVEYMSLIDTLEMLAEPEEIRAFIIEDLIKLYRTGSYSHIAEDSRAAIMHLYASFIGLCRTKMENAVGMPIIINSVTGREVRDFSMLVDVVEEEFMVVRSFEDSIAVPDLWDVYDNLTEEGTIRILEFVKYCVEHRSAMFYQAFLYYDLRSQFVCDDEFFVIDGRKYRWRRMLGTSKDDVLDFRGPLYSLKFADYGIVCKMKYFSKYNYEIYCFRRRTQPCCHRTVRIEPLKRVPILLWCRDHGRYLCTHSPHTMSHIERLSTLSQKEIMFFREMFDSLSQTESKTLKMMSGVRCNAEILAMVVMILGGVDALSQKCKDYVLDEIDYLLYGLLTNRTKGSHIVKQRLGIQMLDRNYKFIESNIAIDVRDLGYCEGDREDDHYFVDGVLNSHMQIGVKMHAVSGEDFGIVFDPTIVPGSKPVCVRTNRDEEMVVVKARRRPRRQNKRKKKGNEKGGRRPDGSIK